MLNSHNLLGYIDRKLLDPEGAIHIDMSQMAGGTGGHPHELDQVENLNKLDQAKYLATKLEEQINSGNVFTDEDELKIAKTNLKCL